MRVVQEHVSQFGLESTLFVGLHRHNYLYQYQTLDTYVLVGFQAPFLGQLSELVQTWYEFNFACSGPLQNETQDLLPVDMRAKP